MRIPESVVDLRNCSKVATDNILSHSTNNSGGHRVEACNKRLILHSQDISGLQIKRYEYNILTTGYFIWLKLEYSEPELR
jgi:hypothetical protein